MTEVWDKRYWCKLIGEAKERYNEWCKRREPRGADWQEWQDWHAWRMARIEYFNDERRKLDGNTHYTRVGYLNATARDARDRRGNARS